MKNILLKIKEHFRREDSELEEKYISLFGPGAYEDAVHDHRKERRIKYAFIFVIFLLLISFAIYDSFRTQEGVIKDDDRIVRINRAKEGDGATAVDVRVTAVSDKLVMSKSKQIVLSSYSEKDESEDLIRSESKEDELERKIDQELSSLNADRSEKTVKLPMKLDDGTELIWKEERNRNYVFVMILFLLVMYYMHRTRFRKAETLEKEAKESVIRELPQFINEVVMQLNAGVVLEQSIIKTVGRMKKGTYFSDQMIRIKERSESTNEAVFQGFYDFAKRCRVREMMRISNIITDNMNKGTDLKEKLQREASLLWFERKKQSEEKGRLAETKLTLPLVILLLVLVMITIAPAMIEM
jgi:tight adherence protein C